VTADANHENTPAAAWAWLTQQLAGRDAASASAIPLQWRALCRELDGWAPAVVHATDLPSDYWVARFQRSSVLLPQAVWSMPERLDQWPIFGTEAAFGFGPGGRRSSASALDDMLRKTDPLSDTAGSVAAQQLLDLASSSASPHDQATISVGQVRAWLATAFGGLLATIVTIPANEILARDLTESALERLAMAGDTERWITGWDELDFGCESLYCSTLLRRADGRQGQTADWQNHWKWLSAPQTADEVSATLELVGRLLVNRPLLSALGVAVTGIDDGVRRRAICVARRWLLTLRAMAWLFEALRYGWSDVRPQDLTCFAFAALSPEWPRRAAAISHRSAEVKPLLRALKLWKAPYAAVDATYVPARETNIGMIWSLFAAVPLLVRVVTPDYQTSVWCRREQEVFQYLVDHSDFLEGRTVIDLSPEWLPQLDRFLVDTAEPDEYRSRIRTRDRRNVLASNEFPPPAFALSAAVASELDLFILRAGGALRLRNMFTKRPQITNELVQRLVQGEEIGGPPPTGNLDGWIAYATIFRDLIDAVRRIVPSTVSHRFSPQAPLSLPDDYTERWYDKQITEQVPDLHNGRYNLADLAAALEWQSVVLKLFIGLKVGDRVIVDVTATTAKDWMSSTAHSVGRGLIALNTFHATWILQNAGQAVDTWIASDRPIFTQHYEDQFDWLFSVHLEPQWLLHYLAHSGLNANSELTAVGIATVSKMAGRDKIRMSYHDSGTVSLRVPLPEEFFSLPHSPNQFLAAWTNQLLDFQ
jgi:hypothetical protein